MTSEHIDKVNSNKIAYPPSRKVLIGASVMVLLIAATGLAALLVRLTTAKPHPAPTWVEKSGNTMGSTFRLLLVNPFELGAKQPIRDLMGELQRDIDDTELLVSTWKSDSQLSQFNQQSTTDWFPVDDRIVEMVQLASEISAIDKRFDITVAPLSDLWGLGPNGRTTEAPSQNAIVECLQHVGSQKLEFRRAPPALRKTDPLVRVDLSALAAGYVVDRLAKRLSSMGVVDFYLEVAGEIVTHGKNRRGESWRVGIAEPKVGSQAIHKTLTITDCAIATSGNYRKFIEINGQRLGHIINPMTGQPITTDILSATIIDQSCARADALATLLMTMPSQEALQLADKQNWNVLLLVASSDGEISTLQPQGASRGSTR